MTLKAAFLILGSLAFLAIVLTIRLTWDRIDAWLMGRSPCLMCGRPRRQCTGHR